MPDISELTDITDIIDIAVISEITDITKSADTTDKPDTTDNSRLGKNELHELPGAQFLKRFFRQICQISRQIWILERAN